MRIDNAPKEQIKNIFNNLDNYIKLNNPDPCIKYLDLGTHKIRLICFSKEFVPHIEKQLTYVLKNSQEKYDSTIVLWKEDNIGKLPAVLDKQFNPKINLKLRVELLVAKADKIDLQIFDEKYSKHNPIISTNFWSDIFTAYNLDTNTHYYGVKSLEPEEFIKNGHIFVQIFNKILKTPTTNLAHGAVVGLENKGILFCARGQRGKSTLAVLSMMKGFDYVSDDYLILEKDGKNLYTYPIYSIITLSPRMYNELYDELEGCRFVSNNARKDKYVINIKKFHNQFKKKYPVKVCMFPEIVSDKEPSIEPCSKGRAITQLIQSTLAQMNDLNDITTIKKMLDMVIDFDFYKINLCSDINKNTEFLRDFIENFDNRKILQIDEAKMFVDITFNLANILNSETGIIYSMNKFATNVYENLIEGVSPDLLLTELQSIEGMPDTIENDYKLFLHRLFEKEILTNIKTSDNKPDIKKEFVKEDNYKLSLIEHNPEECFLELLKEENKETKNDKLCVK